MSKRELPRICGECRWWEPMDHDGTGLVGFNWESGQGRGWCCAMPPVPVPGPVSDEPEWRLPEVGVRSRCSIGERGDNEWTRYKEEQR